MLCTSIYRFADYEIQKNFHKGRLALPILGIVLIVLIVLISFVII